MPLTPEELARRTRVWDAMSDLFVDTETRWTVPRIALALVQSGYSTEELEGIWRREVVPECAANLADHGDRSKTFVVDESALALRAEGGGERSTPESPLPESLVVRWRTTLALGAHLRAIPEEERTVCTSVWTAFVRVYLARSLETLADLEAQIETLAATDLGEVELIAMFEDVHDPLRSFLLPDELVDEPRRAIEVRVLIGLAARATT